MVSTTPQLDPSGHLDLRTSSPDEAEAIVSDLYLPHRLGLPAGVSRVAMQMQVGHFGSLTAGFVSYGVPVTVDSVDAVDIHLDIALRGRSTARSGTRESSVVTVGGAVVLPPGAPLHLEWSADCAQLCLMVPRATLEAELEELIGRSLPTPLDLDLDLDLRAGLKQTWDPVIRLLLGELRNPTALGDHPVAAKHIEAIVLDSLLLGHQHNHRELLEGHRAPGPQSAVARAVTLLHDHPEMGWSTVRLAREVHLSVRALQAGFRRDVGQTPMEYLRDLRLTRVHDVLLAATTADTTVKATAHRYGLLHLGRFAAAYRAVYGEMPVETLRRPPG